MSELGSILSGLSKERKTPKEDGKHYVPFNKAEWEEVALGFECAPEDLEPKQLKALIQAIASGKIKITSV